MMNTNKAFKSFSSFPLTVSSILIAVTVVIALIASKLEAAIFVSVFDLWSLNIIIMLLLFLGIIWILLLLFESFSLGFGKLYKPIKWFLFFIFYPLAIAIAWLLRVSKESMQTSFLVFQNRLFLINTVGLNKDRVLLLLPHCLQFHDCKIRITRDIKDCEQCGKCDICSLKELGDKYDLKVGIANGGTLARKIVHDTSPDIIIAVACHRDLTDGVRESWKYPVYAILNERPFGPCFDTRVDATAIEDIIRNTKYTK